MELDTDNLLPALADATFAADIEPAVPMLSGPPRMIVFTLAQQPLADGSALMCTSWIEFLMTRVPPLGFYLLGCDPALQIALLSEIRKSSWWSLPVFASRGPMTTPLVDAQLDLDEATRQCHRAHALRHNLRLDSEALQGDERILYYLYQREMAELTPVCDRSAPQLYRFPVLESLGLEPQYIGKHLTSLVRRRLLEPVTLIDRTRHCRKCLSAHIHYLDVCPSCSNLNIRKARSLHCFSCGQVGAEETFRTTQGMVCPKCSTNLRHIGVDYDRPLTQYACAGCNHVFVETSVNAKCLDCGTSCAPSELDVREVTSLRLTSTGRAALRSGQIKESFAALDTANFIAPDFFKRLVDWALSTHPRHKEMRFALTLVEFTNTVDLIEKHGAARVFLLLDEFARRLHELLRNSDLTTRTEEQRLWIFLPFSSGPGFAARLQRALSEVGGGTVGQELSATIRCLQAPDEVGSEDTADTLMMRLLHR